MLLYSVSESTTNLAVNGRNTIVDANTRFIIYSAFLRNTMETVLLWLDSISSTTLKRSCSSRNLS